MDYLILGLPRSRTSWLSFALNAMHEHISSGGDPLTIPKGFGTVEINPFIEYPLCKTIIIERDPIDVAESLSYFYTEKELEEGYIERKCLLAYERLLEVAKERNALVIKFNDISDSRDVISEYLGITINKLFWDNICLYRIEPIADNLDGILDSPLYE